ncbi:bifunctional diguanylate cyclase/phosphodiesterase [Colwellia sp. 1_MG-2023]|uniref:putative bifunctional diguanylate cyclase/phosphodiesterase n=1 Tax=Colwellia sp. 1_MG-2023 TaxID=3062649 RepID=UPI0026E26644|nr:bifunctional diguanylate cyclase/phosphodiesterase [Colwellia sp. 1_MG-2023]MDO6444888.1 bifunctional diguanylate cyclase/phosphodiesterase [Colwellia sp. 1_MG-2023]
MGVDNNFALGFLFSIETVVYSFLTYLLYSFYQGFGRRYVKYWTLSLACLSVQHLAISIQHLLPQYDDLSPGQILLTCIIQVNQYLFIWLFFIGLYYTNKHLKYSNRFVKKTIFVPILLGIFVSLLFAFDEQAVFNRFYLRESLADFIFAGIFMFIFFFVFNLKKLHFSGTILLFYSALMCFRYLLFSFLSVGFLTEPWLQEFAAILVYFDFGAKVTLGFLLLVWMQGAERSVAEVAINRAQYLDKHDLLTGALNREQVIEKLPLAIEQAVANNQKLAVYLIDIKRFKFINDTYGLKVGDLILGQIAVRLSESILLPLVVGRLSGDSFVFAIEIIDDSQQEKAAQHLHDLISRPYLVNNQEVPLQCSVGYCLSPQDSNEAEDLLKKANSALFHAESQKIPSVKYESGMQSHGRHLLAVEKEIRKGLLNQEFILYYQPQLNLLTNRIEGVEALVRWQHPEKGFLSPDKFLPDFDALGLNGELDNYVLDLACKTNAHWYKKYKRRVAIAVNMTAVEFQDPKLVSKIQMLLFKYDIPSSYLELEITENVVITDISVAMDTIVVLQNMGIKVSIDDFGTGYSSLAYLRQLPIDKIKIDRSFITEFSTNDSDLTIVTSMIKLSHGLGKRVLAEGVETLEQLNLLRKLGCDAVQGYFINPPLPAEKIEDYLTRKK